MRRIVCLWAATVAILLAFATPASATHVQCGDTITADTTLDSDLVDCHPIGLSVSGPGITLDLNGHTIDGQGAGAGGGIGVGVQWLSGDATEVKNGTVRQFGTGVDVGGASETSGHRVTGNTITETTNAVNFNYTRDTVITENAFSRFGVSAIRLAGPGSGFGPPGNDGALIAGNTFDRAIPGGGGPAVFSVGGGADDNVVTGNLFAGEGGGGGLAGDRNVISANRFQGMNAGFGVGGTGNLVELNTATGPPGSTGFLSQGANTIRKNEVNNFTFGIYVEGDGARITRNSVSEGHFGIYVDDATDAGITRNEVRDVFTDGIFVTNSASGTLVAHNFVAGSRLDDGIDVENPATTITRNKAYRNRDLGIEAVPGVIDGGGNKARANGNRLQCTGVRCR